MNWIRVTMNVTLTHVSVYCIASKITLLQWRISNADPPSIMFVEFFREKCLLAMDKHLIKFAARAGRYSQDTEPQEAS